MKRSRHNPIPPPWYRPLPVVLSEAYEREVERSTEKLERQYARAQKRADQAEARLARAKAVPAARAKKHQIALLEQEVELRRAELEEFRRLMNHATRSPGRGAMHRTGREERLEMGGVGRKSRSPD